MAIKMDLHERYMNQPTNQYMSTNGYSNNYYDGTYYTPTTLEIFLVKEFMNNIKSGTLSFERLETLHTVYCFFYQSAKNGRQIYPLSYISIPQLQECLTRHPSVETKLIDIIVLNKTLYQEAVDDFKDLHDSICSHQKETRMIGIKLMGCFLDSLTLKKNFFSKEIDTSIDMFLNLVRSGLTLMEDAECKLLLLFLPKLMNLASPQSMWKMCLELSNVPKNALTALCLIADVCLPTNSSKNDSMLADNCLQETFWQLLFAGLSNPAQQQRKQALYLVKCAIEFMDSRKDAIMGLVQTDHYKEVTPLVCVGNTDMQESFQKVRNDFFLILEGLEEKQKHLVTPVLPLMNNLLKGYRDHKDCLIPFHIAWIRCAFERILSHDNNAVVKWGLFNALTLDIAIYTDQFITLLLNVLNNTFLYEQEANEDQPAVVKELSAMLKRTDSNEVHILQRFILNASEISWNPVALFYVIQALSMTQEEVHSIWREDQLNAVKSLVEKNLTMHSRTLRIASQIGLLSAIIHYTTESCDLRILANTLSAFPPGEALARGNKSWTQVSYWLARIIKSCEAVKFIVEITDRLKSEESQMNMSIRSFSLIVMLLHDAHLVLRSNNCSAGTALNELLHCLIGADSRLYASGSSRDNSIELMSCLLDICKSSGDCGSIYELVSPYVPAALRYTFKNLRRLSDLTCYEKIHNYVSAISNFFNDKDIVVPKRELLNHVERLEAESMYILEDAELSNNVQRLFGLRILNVCLKADVARPKNYKYIDALLEAYVIPLTQSSKDLEGIEMKNDGSNLRGKVASEYYKLVAELIYEYVKEVSVDAWVPKSDWLEHVSRLVEIGGKEIVVPIVVSLKEIIRKKPLSPTEVASLQSIVRVCWRTTFECRKTELFWLAMDQLIELLFSSPFIAYEETKELVMDCANEMLEEGNNVPGLNKMLLKGLEMYAMDTDVPFAFHEQLLGCLLHGSVPRRDQRIEIQAYSYIAAAYEKDYPDHLSIMFNNTDATTRAQAAVQLHKMITAEPDHAAKLLPLVIARLEKDKDKRYFADSLLHRMKHRLMQILLILQPALNEEDSTRLYGLICEVMVLESSQPSVRFMQEWLLVRLCLAHESLRDKIWNLFEQGNEKRPGSLSSVISVVYHVSRLLEKEQQNFLLQAIPFIMPCCMAQQFNVRLYGQVVLAKFVELAMELNYTTVLAKYNSIYTAVVKSLQHGNLQKNSVKIQEDFYFTVFHPENDYSLQTIYHELPRLTNMCADEWVLPKTFEVLDFKEHINHPIKLLNSKHLMSQAEVSPHMLKSSASGGPVADDIDSSVNGSSNIQKKIIPWKSMMPIDEDLSQISNYMASRSKVLSEEDGIIVVASLIDRPPNLGGLSRTCEIFGAKEFVISSLQHTEDKQFQNLSVSAEKWIPITEVKPHELKKYLMEKKDMGYSLVGAEQTANSKNLQEMKFDKKTVLLLGNEKEGIPANLIPLLDVCVEIPQVGVVRSLNVHVTGAICIWQYSQQHTLP